MRLNVEEVSVLRCTQLRKPPSVDGDSHINTRSHRSSVYVLNLCDTLWHFSSVSAHSQHPLSPFNPVTQWKEASYKQLEKSTVNMADLFASAQVLERS